MCGPVKSVTGDYVEYEDYFKLEALCRSLVGALKDWQKLDTESGDKHPCPDRRIKMITYRIEKHTTVEWIVTGQINDEPIRNVIAKCPDEVTALTIKGMYEKEEQQDNRPSF